MKKTFQQKDIRTKKVPTSFVRTIESFQKQLQREENIKFGRKARKVSFLLATHEFIKLTRGFVK